MDGQLSDGKGNLFPPSKDQQKLAKAGWVVVSRNRKGCMWIINWLDPINGDVWSQGTALIIYRTRKTYEKLKSEK